MTRFARAKGSKASNERTPDESTPWAVMKQQLEQNKKEKEDSKKREEAEKLRIENYEKFLNEQKIAKRKTTWCDFPEIEAAKKSKLDTCKTTSGSKKKKSKKSADCYSKSDDIFVKDESIKSESKKDIINTPPKKRGSKIKFQCIHSELTEPKLKAEITNSQTVIKKVKKGKNNPKKNEYDKINKFNNTFGVSNSNKQEGNKKKEKKDGFARRRKAIDDKSFQLIINGKEVELIRFDGFPIMKKDAERLSELKKMMFKKGIPKSEVDRTLKLERRRAEKALARLKKDVCYNCRKGGHNLSDCPELKSSIPVEGVADGVCFKCGSTEHRQFECKVQKSGEYKFASCFICKEQGHIARQCPDNPRGLYPNGGGCKLCGDVTHLKKDCPTLDKEKEVPTSRLSMWTDGDGLEDGKIININVDNVKAFNKPKKIKF